MPATRCSPRAPGSNPRRLDGDRHDRPVRGRRSRARHRLRPGLLHLAGVRARPAVPHGDGALADRVLASRHGVRGRRLTALTGAAAIRVLRREPAIRWPAVLAFPLVLAQAGLGAVGRDRPRSLVGDRALRDRAPADRRCHVRRRRRSRPTVRRVPWVSGAGSFAHLASRRPASSASSRLVGTYVRASGAQLVFTDWPLMDGRLVPALGGGGTAMFLHRARGGGDAARPVDGNPGADRPGPRDLSWSGCRPSPRSSSSRRYWSGGQRGRACDRGRRGARRARRPDLGDRIALATVASCSAVGPSWRLTPRSRRAGVLDRSATRSRRTTWLTKPRIVLLLPITTVPAMLLAARGFPSPWLILATLAGGALAAGSANAINMYLDRDIDAIMRRTRQRPLLAHAISPNTPSGSGSSLARSPSTSSHRGQRAGGDPGAVRDRLLRLRLHDVAGSGRPRRTS